MSINATRQLTNKIRYITGLTNVLEYEIDILRECTNEGDLVKIENALCEIDKTLQKLASLVNEIKHILNLDK